MDTQPVFSACDRLGTRGLADVEIPGSGRERPGLHHSDQHLHDAPAIHMDCMGHHAITLSGLPLVGLHSNLCSIPEASWPALNISSAGTWFQARREVCTLREDPRRGGRGDENIRQVSICRHGAAARRESFSQGVILIHSANVVIYWTPFATKDKRSAAPEPKGAPSMGE